MFLSLLARYVPKFQPDFVLKYWKETASNVSDINCDTVQHVLLVLGILAKNHPDRDVISSVAGHQLLLCVIMTFSL